jgi:hypothetical protein
MLIYAKIMNKHGGCVIERYGFFEFCIQKSLKELKATIYHEALDILTVVSSLDCCLLDASLSRACSFSSTTNKFFLHDFVVNHFVPVENCCECLFLMNKSCSLWSDSFRHLSLPCIARNFNILIIHHG